jgi:hypothetical protein
MGETRHVGEESRRGRVREMEEDIMTSDMMVIYDGEGG